MEKKTYKYIVEVQTLVWENENYIEDYSTEEQTEIINEDPLIAREMAFKKS